MMPASSLMRAIRQALMVSKVYRRLPGPEAESYNMLRVIDEDKSKPRDDVTT